jgi:hypothetical protein
VNHALNALMYVENFLIVIHGDKRTMEENNSALFKCILCVCVGW